MGILLRDTIIDITLGNDGLRHLPLNEAIIKLGERLSIQKSLRKKEGD